MRLTIARPALVVLLFLVGLAVIAGVSRTSAQTPPQGWASYIVVLRDAVPDTDGEIARIEQASNAQAEFRFRTALKGFSARLTPSMVQLIERLPWVEFVSPDQEVHAVGSVPLQAGDSAPTGIRRIDAASATTARQASTVNVAVIDTGIDLSHPDLNAASGKNCVSSSSPPQDDNGHGTHVAGTIGAKNTGSGVVGVVPGTLQYAVKVLNSSGSGTWSQVICGIDWVTANASALNIKVANMSLGGGGSNDNNCGNSNNDALHKAICNSTAAGVTYVIAAGNSNANFASSVPASYPEVLTVTAMTDSDGLGGALGGAPTCRSGEQDDRYASFSNYANSSTDRNHTIAGPGTCIYSTWVSGSTHTYNTISGTSMATPHVAGSVALCFGDGGTAGPCAGMTPAQVIQKMRSDAQARSSSAGYGFTGDPNNPVSSTRYYGYLVANSPIVTAPDFAIAASPASRTVGQGAGTSYTITATALNGYSGDVDLSVTGLPGGAAGTFTTDTVALTTGGATSTLDITTDGSTPTGTYTLDITGSDGTLSHTVQVTLVVQPVDFTIAASPASRTVTQGGGTTYTVTLTSLGGYGNSVGLSVLGAPAGATFSPTSVTPTTGGATSTLSITTLSSTSPGSYSLTIRGTDGSLVHDVAVTLVVNPPVQGDFSISVSPTSRTVFRGSSTTYTVTLKALNGYNVPVTLSVSGLGTGMTPSFTPNPVTPTAGGVNSTMRITVSNSASRGTRTLTITGLGTDGKTHSVNVSIRVY